MKSRLFGDIERSAAVIVAHPDDETLWGGGVILSRPAWWWTIVTLCRGSDPDRAPKFARVLERLDHREKGGYRRRDARFIPAEDEAAGELSVLAYVALPSNANYLGEAPLERIAHQVRESAGPSGHNLEYVLELARELARLGMEDPHVSALAALLDGARN